MGKYMRKSRKVGEVALMEERNKKTQSSLGVRTRAKTLALKNLQKSSTPPPEEWSYLERRSRRLKKLSPIDFEGKRQRHVQKYSNLQSKGNVSVKHQRGSSRSRLGVKSSEEKKEEKEKGCLDGEGKIEEENLQGNKDEEEKMNNSSGGVDLGVEEASFGDNVLEFEGRERTTRESTPCSLIRDPDTIRSPGSSTKPAIATDTSNRGDSLRRHIPTAHEMDEFFAGAEEQQQKQFVEKYNFDPVNDKPLLGRYEWEKLNNP